MTLASFAAHPEKTRGRKVIEQESPTRNVFQRDRDRIIHSTAFRRLEYKVGLNPVSPSLPFSPATEIGWRLNSAYWGQGLATEAAQAAVKFSFEQCQLTEIIAFTALQNLRSQALMQRLGMQREAVNFEHPALAKSHHLAEHCLYRLSREQYYNFQSLSHPNPRDN